MKPSESQPRLPAPVRNKLRDVRRLLRRYVVVQSLLLIGCWLLLVFWCGGLLDYLPVRAGSNETPRWLRMGLLAMMAAGSLWICVRWSLPKLWHPVRDSSLALLIERGHPELNNALVTVVESEGEQDADVSNPVAHQAMLERVRGAVAARIDRVSPLELFNWQPIWASGTALVFGLLITVITAFGMPDWLELWSKRLFALSDQAWPRDAALRADGIQLQFPGFTGQLTAERVLLPFQAGRVRVPSGAAAMLQISADVSAKRVPDVCTLFYQAADGARGRANLRRVGSPRDGWQQFTLDGPPLDGMTQDISLDVVGLDARLRDLQLEVVEPVVVAAMQVECSYPQYLAQSVRTRAAFESLAYRAGMRIPEGTAVTLVGKASTPLQRAEYVILSSSDEAASSGSPSVQRVVPSDDTFRIPLGNLRSSQVVEIRLVDQFGLASEQILRYVISVLEDEEPLVESSLEGIGIAVTPRAVLPIRGSVVDDNGIAATNLEMAIDESQSLSLPLELDRDGKIVSDIDLEKLASTGGLTVEPEMTLGLVVSAHDFFDLDGEPHVGRGQPQQLAVVTADQLLVILDRQELELRKRLELIIFELEQVDEALEGLIESLQPAGEQARRPPAEHPLWLVAARQQDADPAAAAAQQQRMLVLRAQQSILQCDKSEQELTGVASRVENIRLQLLNNRIDSYDRQERLQARVHTPLVELLSGDYQQLSNSLAELQTATMSGAGLGQAQASARELARVLEALNAIKDNMFDIESYNQIVDLVRTLLEDQESLLEEAEKQQKARILDLLR